MNRGGKVICGVAVLAVAACSGHQDKMRLRPIPAQLAQGAQAVPFRIAEARGQLALGNVALALESFRKALRQDPASVDALAGIASCYDHMGRFDLSRRHYEAALAVSPADTQLLSAFAGSLDLQGRKTEAASVRSEIAVRLAAATAAAEPAPPLQIAEKQPVPAHRQAGDVQQSGAITSGLAAQQVASVPPTPAFRKVVSAAPAPALRNEIRQVPSSSPPPVAIAAESVEIADLKAAPLALDLPVNLAEAQPVEPGPSVTIKLPPPRPAPTRTVALRDSRTKDGPRLERLSMGEVALLTVSAPQWRSELVSRSARSTTIRFVPVRPATDVVEVQLLNAARVHRLAARTRAWLAGRGWRGVSIGDAPSTRSRSIIFYPAGQRSVARKLSAQFGFAMAPRHDLQLVTVLLGQDSVRIAGARTKG